MAAPPPPIINIDPMIIAMVPDPGRVHTGTIWTHVQRYLLGIPNNTHPCTHCFVDYGYAEFGDLMVLSVPVIDTMTYRPAGANADAPLPRGFIGRIKVLISLYNDMSRQLGANIDLRTVQPHHFDDYRVTYYDINYPLGRRNHAAAPIVANANPRNNPSQDFFRGIKKDKGHYKEFKDAKNFDAFRRNVVSTAFIHRTSNVLNAAYVPDPNDPEAIALFEAEQGFMYTVFDKVCQTDKSRALVHQYEHSQDAQSIWRDLVAHQVTSTCGTILKETILTHLTTHRLTSNQWKGSIASYITHWRDKLHEYESLQPNAPFDDPMKRTLLQAAVSMIPELDNVKSTLHLELTQGRPLPNFQGYVELIESVGTIIDSRNTKVATKSLAKDMAMINTHDQYDPKDYYETIIHDLEDVHHNINTPIESLTIYRAKRSPTKFPAKSPYQRYQQLSLDRETWSQIPKEYQDVWDKFPPHIKNTILTGTRKKGAESVLNRKPVDSKKFTPAKPSGWKPPISAHIHEQEDDPEEIPSQANLTHDFSDILTDHSDDIETSLLVNMAKSRLDPGDIRRVLSQASSVKKTSTKPADNTYSISFHCMDDSPSHSYSLWMRFTPSHLLWLFTSFVFFLITIFSFQAPTSFNQTHDFYTVSATKRTVHSARGALVDRGANGGIAGNDVKIVSKTGWHQ